MKKCIFLIILIGLFMLLGACGGGEDTSNVKDTKENVNSDEVADTDTTKVGLNNEVHIIATNFDLGKDKFVVEAGKEVTLTLTNEEGNHGIVIDELDVNLDGEGEVTFTPEEPGEYTIYCNIFCGEGHDEMTATLVVV